MRKTKGPTGTEVSSKEVRAPSSCAVWRELAFLLSLLGFPCLTRTHVQAAGAQSGPWPVPSLQLMLTLQSSSRAGARKHHIKKNEDRNLPIEVLRNAMDSVRSKVMDALFLQHPSPAMCITPESPCVPSPVSRNCKGLMKGDETGMGKTVYSGDSQ